MVDGDELVAPDEPASGAGMRSAGDDAALDWYLHGSLSVPRPDGAKHPHEAARDAFFDFLVPGLAAVGECTATTDWTGTACTYEVALADGTVELTISTMLPLAAVLVRSRKTCCLTDLRGSSDAEHALRTLLAEHGITILPEEVLRARSRLVGYDIDGERWGETYYELLFTDEYLLWDVEGFVSVSSEDEDDSGAVFTEARTVLAGQGREADERLFVEDGLRHVPPRVRGARPALPMAESGDDAVLDHFLYLALGPARPESTEIFQRAAARGQLDVLVPRLERLGDVIKGPLRPGQVACTYTVRTCRETIHLAVSTVLPFCSVLVESSGSWAFSTLEDGQGAHDALRDILAEIHVSPLPETRLRGRSRYYADGGEQMRTYYELLVGPGDLPWDRPHFTTTRQET